MIHVPDHVTTDMVVKAVKDMPDRKGIDSAKEVKLERIEEGLCV